MKTCFEIRTLAFLDSKGEGPDKLKLVKIAKSIIIINFDVCMLNTNVVRTPCNLQLYKIVLQHEN